MAQVENRIPSNSCFADQLHQKMLKEHPVYNANHLGMEKQLYGLKNEAASSSTRSLSAQTIPVVVHIIHQNGAENISNAQVFDAIQHLNDAFKNLGVYDPSTGVDTEIEFCLAIRDPQNNSSIGINRIESALTDVIIETQDQDLKALLQWNPLDYLNIWVVNEITSVSFGPDVAGYAYFPAAHGFAEDGIVMEANFMGSSPSNSKVLVHEAGHYLGLYHTFEGGCSNNDCQLNGDRICDTPPDQSTAPVTCGLNINTCDTDEDDTSINNPFRPIALGGLGDQNDMHINYMDYGYQTCFSAFTEGQKERMNNALSTTRQSLLSSFGCQSPCSLTSYDASFMSTPSSSVLVGDLVTFNNGSDPADIYEWSIDNELISNTTNSSYTFNQEGLYTVNLFIQDTINNCQSTFEQIIEVICEGDASFTTTSTEVLPGETVSFINTSSGNDSYQWFLDGALYSTDNDISLVLTDPGYYSLYLVGVTDFCLNYSSTVTIIVGTCTEEDKSEMHWYFGENTALDFNSGEPVAVPGSQLTAFEGSACFSDNNGNLLFYTNGVNIWDASNTVMPNGSDLMGGALTSAWNQALIIPCPHNSDQYYVFTCDEAENAYANGIRYSKVDMTLNGGRGDITDVKNVFLCPVNYEIMSAAYHDDGQNSWLLITDNDDLNTYLIDSTGVGPAITSDVNYDNFWGFHQFLNSGKKMIAAQASSNGAFLVMLDFDNVNGTFSNPIEINTAGGFIWAFEFSPDDSKLYCSLINDTGSFELYQFDLSLTTGPQISNSKTLIGSLPTSSMLVLGPNGKIYNRGYAPDMGVINKPNEQGVACDYIREFINLDPEMANLSLPKFIRGQRYDPGLEIPSIRLGPDQSICNGLTTVLDPGNGDYDFLWQDGSTNSTYTAWLPGTYWVTASNACGSVTDSIDISLDSLGLVDLGDDRYLCDGMDITLDAGAQGDYYLWQDGSSSSTLIVSEPGTYSVELSTQSGCYEGDSITIELDTQAPTIDCPMNVDTLVSMETSEVLLNPGLPNIIDSCPYTYVNNFTNTNDATDNYPAGATTTLTWTVTDINGNSSSCNTDVNVLISTGTSYFDHEMASLILYPNPGIGVFTIEETQNIIGDIALSVFDQLGRKVYEQTVFLQGKLSIDLSDQAAGTYFLHWSTSNNSGVFKLISESP